MKLHSTIDVDTFIPVVPELKKLTEAEQMVLTESVSQEAVLEHMLQVQRDKIVDDMKRRPEQYFTSIMSRQVNDDPTILDVWKTYGGTRKITSLNHATVPFYLQLQKAGTKRLKKATTAGTSLSDRALYFVVLRLSRDTFRPTGGRRYGRINVYTRFFEDIRNELEKMYGHSVDMEQPTKWALDKEGHQYRMHFSVPLKAKSGATVEGSIERIGAMIVQLAGATHSSTQEVFDHVVEMMLKNPSVHTNEGETLLKPEPRAPKTLKELFNSHLKQ